MTLSFSLLLSNVFVQFSFARPHLPLLLASLRFGFSMLLCLEGQYPGVVSSPSVLRLVFCCCLSS